MEDSKIQKIEIVVGFACNNNCRFCSIGQRGFNKTTEQIKQDIRRAAEETKKEIMFTGGEPTIRKDIFELIQYSKTFNFKDIRVTTNGRMFSYENFANKTVSSGLTGAIFSIHGHTPELHDYLTSVPGSFKQLMGGYKNLKDLGGIIDVNTVINTKNYMILPELANLLIKNDVRAVCLIFPTIDGNILKQPELVPDMYKATPYIHKTIDILTENGNQAWSLNIPVCFMQGYEKYSELMELKTKMFWPDQDTTLDKKRLEGKVQVKACEKCRFRLVCAGICEKYVKLKGEDNIRPVKGELVTDAKEFYGG